MGYERSSLLSPPSPGEEQDEEETRCPKLDHHKKKHYKFVTHLQFSQPKLGKVQ
jgi:hypothetical protein